MVAMIRLRSTTLAAQRLLGRCWWALFVACDTITFGPWRARRHDAKLMREVEAIRARGSGVLAERILAVRRRCNPA